MYFKLFARKETNFMELFIQILDYVLIGAAIWAIFVARGMGGLIGRAFGFMMWGMILLGIAHISETITFEMLKWDIDLVELVHRLIVLAGFVLLIMGFSQIPKIKEALE